MTGNLALIEPKITQKMLFEQLHELISTTLSHNFSNGIRFLKNFPVYRLLSENIQTTIPCSTISLMAHAYL